MLFYLTKPASGSDTTTNALATMVLLGDNSVEKSGPICPAVCRFADTFIGEDFGPVVQVRPVQPHTSVAQPLPFPRAVTSFKSRS